MAIKTYAPQRLKTKRNNTISIYGAFASIAMFGCNTWLAVDITTGTEPSHECVIDTSTTWAVWAWQSCYTAHN